MGIHQIRDANVAVRTMKCSDCKGSGMYEGFNLPPEPCRLCEGMGALNAEGMPDMLNKGSIKTLEGLGRKSSMSPPSGGGIIFSQEDCDRINGVTPKLKIGDIIHVYDAGWIEAKVVHVYIHQGVGVQCGQLMVRADFTGGHLRVSFFELNYNITQRQWEYIRSGTPTYP